jgi:uncharacterized protein
VDKGVDTCLDTTSGKRINLLDPDPEAIHLSDVAGALSRVCRFAAQAREFYSVAQHALWVQSLVEQWDRRDLSLAALHHDSHEAFICDVPTPLKRILSRGAATYDDIATKLDRAIAEAFGFEPPEREDRQLIKRADDCALLVEADVLMPALAKRSKRGSDGDQQRLPKLGSPLRPEDAERHFRQAHARAHRRTAGYTRSAR